MSTIITIPVQIEIPDDMLSVESVAICEDGSPIAFSKHSNPVQWKGRWENTRQHSKLMKIANWKETLTRVNR